MDRVIPKWIILYLWFLTITTILFTLIGYFMPDIHNIIDYRQIDQNNALSLYLSRNIAIIAIYLFAIFSHRIIVFKSVIILRGVIDLFDFVQNLLMFDIMGIPISFVLLGIDIFALITLYKIKK